ncbi:F-type H+-transporting ATPase subunit gamma [Candidatus Gastranaerophilus sp. (ex Termes propinquus)]|nr:F-type H+-transporting ATPase subunit gamma [Candidatus Gastranaerophilus sp. (ex Termes propinquus)]
MANIRAIKDRIKSISNTQKITKAMKMVAAAKVRRAESAVKESRPFTFELLKIFTTAYDKICNCNYAKIKCIEAVDNYPALLKTREIKTVGIVVVSSNKGLAGAYSGNIVRFCIKRIKEAAKKGQKVKLYLVGTKSQAPLKNAKRNLDFEVEKIYPGLMNDICHTSALLLANDLASDYENEKIDSIELITTRYQNMMTYKVEDWTLLPAMSPENCPKEFHRDSKTLENENTDNQAHAIMEFEPSVEDVLKIIVPMYMTNVIYQALLEANASELASRMTAMSAATNNAQNMIEQLTIEYNKKRQEKITNELIEIVSGADALK